MITMLNSTLLYATMFFLKCFNAETDGSLSNCNELVAAFTEWSKFISESNHFFAWIFGWNLGFALFSFIISISMVRSCYLPNLPADFQRDEKLTNYGNTPVSGGLEESTKVFGEGSNFQTIKPHLKNRKKYFKNLSRRVARIFWRGVLKADVAIALQAKNFLENI